MNRRSNDDYYVQLGYQKYLADQKKQREKLIKQELKKLREEIEFERSMGIDPFRSIVPTREQPQPQKTGIKETLSNLNFMDNSVLKHLKRNEDQPIKTSNININIKDPKFGQLQQPNYLDNQQPKEQQENAFSKALDDFSRGFMGTTKGIINTINAPIDFIKGNIVDKPYEERKTAAEKIGANWRSGFYDQVESRIGGNLGYLGEKFGSETLQKASDNVSQFSQDMKKGFEQTEHKEFEWKDIGTADFYVDKASRQLPNLAVSLLGGQAGIGVLEKLNKATKLTGVPKRILNYIGGGLGMGAVETADFAGATYNEAKKLDNVDNVEAYEEVFWKDLLLNSALNSLQVGIALTPLQKQMKQITTKGMAGKATDVTARIGAAGLIEGGQEVAQEKIQSDALKQDFELFSPQTYEAFALGGIIGGATTGVMMATSDNFTMKDRPEQKPIEIIQEIETNVVKNMTQEEKNRFTKAMEAAEQQGLDGLDVINYAWEDFAQNGGEVKIEEIAKNVMENKQRELEVKQEVPKTPQQAHADRFVEGEEVSYQGKDYKVYKNTNGHIQLQNADGVVISSNALNVQKKNENPIQEQNTVLQAEQDLNVDIDEYNVGDMVTVSGLSDEYQVVNNKDSSMLELMSKHGKKLTVGRDFVTKQSSSTSPLTQPTMTPEQNEFKEYLKNELQELEMTPQEAIAETETRLTKERDPEEIERLNEELNTLREIEAEQQPTQQMNEPTPDGRAQKEAEMTQQLADFFALDEAPSKEQVVSKYEAYANENNASLDDVIEVLQLQAKQDPLNRVLINYEIDILKAHTGQSQPVAETTTTNELPGVEFFTFKKSPVDTMKDFQAQDIPFVADFSRNGKPVQTVWFTDNKGKEYGLFREEGKKWGNPIQAKQLHKILQPLIQDEAEPSAQEQYEEMRKEFSLKGNLTSKNKLKLLHEMKSFAENNGLEFSDRYQHFINEFEKEVSTQKETKEQEKQKQVEEAQQAVVFQKEQAENKRRQEEEIDPKDQRIYNELMEFERYQNLTPIEQKSVITKIRRMDNTGVFVVLEDGPLSWDVYRELGTSDAYEFSKHIINKQPDRYQENNHDVVHFSYETLKGKEETTQSQAKSETEETKAIREILAQNPNLDARQISDELMDNYFISMNFAEVEKVLGEMGLSKQDEGSVTAAPQEQKPVKPFDTLDLKLVKLDSVEWAISETLTQEGIKTYTDFQSFMRKEYGHKLTDQMISRLGGIEKAKTTVERLSGLTNEQKTEAEATKDQERADLQAQIEVDLEKTKELQAQIAEAEASQKEKIMDEMEKQGDANDYTITEKEVKNKTLYTVEFNGKVGEMTVRKMRSFGYKQVNSLDPRKWEAYKVFTGEMDKKIRKNLAKKKEENLKGQYKVYRRDNKDAQMLPEDKPHGLYFSYVADDNFQSPHTDVGDTDYYGVVDTKNPLGVDGDLWTRIRGASAPASSGVAALKKLLPNQFDELGKMNKKKLVDLLNEEFPGYDYSNYADSYELLEAYAGQLARKEGYDTIIQIDKSDPNFSEIVVLKNDVLKLDNNRVTDQTIKGYPATMEKSKHTKTGEDIWVVKFTGEVDNWNEISSFMRKHKGRYFNKKFTVKELRGSFVFMSEPTAIFDKAAVKEEVPKQQETPKKISKPLSVIDDNLQLPSVEYKDTKTQISATFIPVQRQKGSIFKNEQQETPSTKTLVFPKGKDKNGYNNYLRLPNGVSVSDINEWLNIEFSQEGVTSEELIATFDMMNSLQPKKTQKTEKPKTPTKKSETPKFTHLGTTTEVNVFDTARNQTKWLSDAAEQAKKRLKSRKNNLNSLPMNDLADYAIIGADLLIKKSIDFAEFSDVMLKEFGSSLKLYMRAIYAQSQAVLDMTPEEIDEMLRQADENYKPENDPTTALAEMQKLIDEQEQQFVDAEFERRGLNERLNKHALQEKTWADRKQIRDELKEMRAKIGRIYIPDHVKSDYKDLVPVSFRAASPNGNYDLYKAAEVVGYGNDIDGFVAKLHRLVKEGDQKKSEVVTEDISDIPAIEQEIREMYRTSNEYEALKATYDQMEQGFKEQEATTKETTEKPTKKLFDENVVINDKKKGEKTDGTNKVRSNVSETPGRTPAKSAPGAKSEGDTTPNGTKSARTSEGTSSGTDRERNDVVGSGGSRTATDHITSAGNYRITDSDDLTIKGKKETSKRNIEIIKLAKQIAAEGRQATSEEQAKLVQFVGWGGLKDALDVDWQLKPEWKELNKELKALLTESEFRSAQGSRLNAHYTSKEVIQQMYAGLAHLGFDGGRILEPSMGAGHFIGLLPNNLASKSKVTGVELDGVTGLIGQLLYPQSDIRVQGFEETKLSDNFYDLAIGNVPFGDYPVADAKYEKLGLTKRIHDYFFAKSLDKVREGGLVVFISSKGTMDKKEKTTRNYLAKQAEFIGAIRLPSNAFGSSANTEVVTDIIVLKKLAPGQEAKNKEWVDVSPYEVNGQTVYINNYFAKNPSMMLGTPTLDGSMYRGNEFNLTSNGNLSEQLQAAFKNLPANIFEKKATKQLSQAELLKLTIPAPNDIKEGAFAYKDGKLYVKEGSSLVPSTLTGVKVDRVKGLIDLRTARRKLVNAQLDNKPTSVIDGLRKELNVKYDAFVKKFGYVNEKANASLFVDDPDYYLVIALEKWDSDKKKGSKSDIFTQDTVSRYIPVTTASNAIDALAVSLNETGTVDVKRIADLLGISEDAAIKELGESIYKDPISDQYVTREEYLSGNVRKKLAIAENASKLDKNYTSNVKALEKVIPETVPAEQIEIALGAGWIGEEYTKEFIGSILDWSGHKLNQLKVNYNPISSSWTVQDRNGKAVEINNDTSFTRRWGSRFKRNEQILEAALNRQSVKVFDEIENADGTKTKRLNKKATAEARQKVEAIQDEFKKWLWEDEKRKQKLEKTYNELFNSYVVRSYDASFMPDTLPNMNPDIKLKEHQKNAVYRITQGGNTLLAHAVGAGKTFEMIAGMMEMKRLGQVKKPLWIVPNHLVDQMARDFNLLYPNANVFVPTKKDFQKENRKKMLAKISSGNYDVIIMAHSSFSKVSMDSKNVERFFMEQIDQLELAIEAEFESGQRSKSRIRSSLEKLKKSLEAKMKTKVSALSQDKDTATFEELGIDGIVVDEAHEFKNLMYGTKRQTVGGLGDKEGSDKAFDLYMKVRYLQQLNGGKGIVFATGTPISNSIAEMYHMMRYLATDTLKEMGFHNFDAWADVFTEISNVLELAPEGKGFKVNEKIKDILNAPELLTLFHSFADVKTSDELLEKGLIKHPPSERLTKEVEASVALSEYVQQLVERAEDVRAKRVQPDEDNMLKITGDGRKAALDMRIIDPMLLDDPNSKVNHAKEAIYEVWKRTKKEKGTQLVFIDTNTPDANGKKKVDKNGIEQFSVYHDLKDKLIRMGIPEQEIAFIHEANTDARKLKLFDDVNTGRVRVLLGSSAKMGAGMNVQKKLKALHHLDVPWRPSDLEQREGRILRQGNEWAINGGVELYTYVQTGSFDAYMWQLIEYKGKMINKVMKGDLKGRRIEDEGDIVLSASALKAIATGDTRIIDFENIKHEVEKLENERDAHLDSNRRNKKRLEVGLPHELTIAQKLYDQANVDASKVEDTKGELFKMEVAGTTFTNRKDAGKKLLYEIDKLKQANTREWTKVGSISNFNVMYRLRVDLLTSKDTEELILSGQGQYPLSIGTETGTIQSMEGNLVSIARKIKGYGDIVEKLNKEKSTLEQIVDKPFSKQQELDEKRLRRDELAAELNIDKEQPGDDTIIDDGSGDDDIDTFVAPKLNEFEQEVKRQAKLEMVKDNRQTNEPVEGTVTRSEILQFIMKEFKVPIGTGRYRSKAKAIYKTKSNVIRTKQFADFEKITHELGHLLDRKYDLSENKELQEELYDFAILNLEIPENMERDEAIREGVAEFMRSYFYDRSKLVEQVPEFYDHFVTTMSELGLMGAIDQLGNKLDTWTGQSARERVSGVIDTRKRTESTTFKNLYTKIVDEISGIKKAVGKLTDDELKGKDDPYKLATVSRGSAGKVESFLEHGVEDSEGNKVFSSLKDILSPVKDLELLRSYLVAKHALTLHKEGKYLTPISKSDAKMIELETIEDHPEVVDAAEQLYEYQHHLLQLLVDGELLTQKAADEMKERYPYYVPFYRVMDEDGERHIEGSNNADRHKKFANQSSAIKGMKDKGSARNIIDPVENIIKNTFMYINMVERNKVGVALSKLVDKTDSSGAIMEKVDGKMKAETFSLAEIEKTLQNAGVDVENINLEEMGTVFRPIFHPSASENVLVVWRNGKQVQYKVRDKDLYQALLNLDNESLQGWVKLLGIPNDILRTGITLSPTFIPKSMLRSIPTMMMQTNSYTTPKDFLQLPFDMIGSFVDVFNKNESYRQWLASGGAQSTLLSIENDYLLESKNRLIANRTTREKLKNAMVDMVKLKHLREIADFLDKGVRLTEYKKALGKTGDRVEAAARSRDVDMDFARFGTHSKGPNKLWLFLNVAIQGPEKVWRTFKAHPQRTIARGAAFLTLPTLALLALNWEDEDYWELEQWERDLFWNIPKGNGEFIRIPIPFEWGLIFKTLPERALAAAFKDDKGASDSFFKTIKNTMMPNLLPTAFIPIVETMTNYSFQNGREIDTLGDLYQKPKDRTSMYTSEVAKAIGEKFDVSPKRVDNFIRSSTGSLGVIGVNFVDWASGAKARSIGETPSNQRGSFARAFISNANDGNTQSTSEFYKRFEKLEGQHKETGIKGKPSVEVKFAREASETMKYMRKMREEVFKNKTLSSQEKGKIINEINIAITDVSRIALRKEPRNKEVTMYVIRQAKAYEESEKALKKK